MKKWFLTLTAAGLFTMPALAADAQMLKHTAIDKRGNAGRTERWAYI